MVKIVQMDKGHTYCHIKSLWKQYSSPILNTSEWCVKFFFCVLQKILFWPGSGSGSRAGAAAGSGNIWKVGSGAGFGNNLFAPTHWSYLHPYNNSYWHRNGMYLRWRPSSHTIEYRYGSFDVFHLPLYLLSSTSERRIIMQHLYLE